MKKYLIVLAVLLAGCESRNVTTSTTTTVINGRNIEIYTIDSCEYIGRVVGSSTDVLTHKGNCKFCEKRNFKK